MLNSTVRTGIEEALLWMERMSGYKAIYRTATEDSICGNNPENYMHLDFIYDALFEAHKRLGE